MDELLNRKMGRAEFLKLLGFGALSLFGLGSFLKAVAVLNASHNTTHNHSLASQPGYDSGPYGGRQKGRS